MEEKIKCAYKNCKEDITQAPLKKPKKFCSDNCRQKDFRDKQKHSFDTIKAERDELLKKVNIGYLPEVRSGESNVFIKDFTKPTNTVKEVGEKPPVSNYTINTNVPPVPKREDFKEHLDFSIAKSEWKSKYNQ